MTDAVYYKCKLCGQDVTYKNLEGGYLYASICKDCAPKYWFDGMIERIRNTTDPIRIEYLINFFKSETALKVGWTKSECDKLLEALNKKPIELRTLLMRNKI